MPLSWQTILDNPEFQKADVGTKAQIRDQYLKQTLIPMWRQFGIPDAEIEKHSQDFIQSTQAEVPPPSMLRRFGGGVIQGATGIPTELGTYNPPGYDPTDIAHYAGVASGMLGMGLAIPGLPGTGLAVRIAEGALVGGAFGVMPDVFRMTQGEKVDPSEVLLDAIKQGAVGAAGAGIISGIPTAIGALRPKTKLPTTLPQEAIEKINTEEAAKIPVSSTTGEAEQVTNYFASLGYEPPQAEPFKSPLMVGEEFKAPRTPNYFGDLALTPEEKALKDTAELGLKAPKPETPTAPVKEIAQEIAEKETKPGIVETTTAGAKAPWTLRTEDFRQALDKIKEDMPSLERQRLPKDLDVLDIELTGSRARGAARPTSDSDYYVFVNKNLSPHQESYLTNYMTTLMSKDFQLYTTDRSGQINPFIVQPRHERWQTKFSAGVTPTAELEKIHPPPPEVKVTPQETEEYVSQFKQSMQGFHPSEEQKQQIIQIMGNPKSAASIVPQGTVSLDNPPPIPPEATKAVQVQAMPLLGVQNAYDMASEVKVERALKEVMGDGQKISSQLLDQVKMPRKFKDVATRPDDIFLPWVRAREILQQEGLELTGIPPELEPFVKSIMPKMGRGIETIGVKEPWQMTYKEWITAIENRPITDYANQNIRASQARDTTIAGVKELERLRYGVRDFTIEGGEQVRKTPFEIYEEILRKAHGEGKPIPQEVLDNFSQLQAQSTIKQLDKITEEARAKGLIIGETGTKSYDRMMNKFSREFQAGQRLHAAQPPTPKLRYKLLADKMGVSMPELNDYFASLKPLLSNPENMAVERMAGIEDRIGAIDRELPILTKHYESAVGADIEAGARKGYREGMKGAKKGAQSRVINQLEKQYGGIETWQDKINALTEERANLLRQANQLNITPSRAYEILEESLFNEYKSRPEVQNLLSQARRFTVSGGSTGVQDSMGYLTKIKEQMPGRYGTWLSKDWDGVQGIMLQLDSAQNIAKRNPWFKASVYEPLRLADKSIAGESYNLEQAVVKLTNAYNKFTPTEKEAWRAIMFNHVDMVDALGGGNHFLSDAEILKVPGATDKVLQAYKDNFAIEAMKREFHIGQARAADVPEPDINELMQHLPANYVSQQRRGNFYVNIKDTKGQTIWNQGFDSAAEARAALGFMKKDPEIRNMMINSGVSPEMIDALTISAAPNDLKRVSMDMDPVGMRMILRSIKNSPNPEVVKDWAALEDQIDQRLIGRGFKGRFAFRQRFIPGFDFGNPGENQMRDISSMKQWWWSRRVAQLPHQDILAGFGDDVVMADYTQKYFKDLLRPEYQPILNKAKHLAFVVNMGLSFRTMIQQLTQPLQVGLADMGIGDLTRGIVDAVTKPTAELRWALDIGRREGTLQDDFINFIASRGFSQNKTMAFIENWIRKPFKAGEEASRVWAFTAKFQQAMRQGMTKEAALDAATRFTDDTLFIYKRYNIPLMIRSNQLAGLALIHKTFGLMFMGRLYSMLNQGQYKPLARTMGAVMALAGITGLPGYQLFQKSYETARGGHTLYNDLNEYLHDKLGDSDVANYFIPALMKGVTPLAGFDLSRSIASGDIFPTSLDPTQMMGAGIAVVNNFLKGGAMAWNGVSDGDFHLAERGIEKATPLAVGRVMAGIRQMYSGRETTPYGQSVTPLSKWQAFETMIGLPPERLSEVREVRHAEQVATEFQRKKSGQFDRKMAEAIVAQDPEAQQKVLRDLMEWNNSNPPERQISINRATIKRYVLELGAGKPGYPTINQAATRNLPKRMREQFRKSRANAHFIDYPGDVGEEEK